MKKVTLFLFYIVFCFTEQGPILTAKQRKLFSDECVQKTGVNQKVIDDAIKHAMIPENEPFYEDYLTCYYKKQGYQSEDGAILYENIQEFLENFYSRNQASDAVNTCRDLKGTNPGNNCYVFLKCLLGNLIAIETSNDENEDIKENEIEVR